VSHLHWHRGEGVLNNVCEPIGASKGIENSSLRKRISYVDIGEEVRQEKSPLDQGGFHNKVFLRGLTDLDKPVDLVVAE
jgi:hypothetical protein